MIFWPTGSRPGTPSGEAALAADLIKAFRAILTAGACVKAERKRVEEQRKVIWDPKQWKFNIKQTRH